MTDHEQASGTPESNIYESDDYNNFNETWNYSHTTRRFICEFSFSGLSLFTEARQTITHNNCTTAFTYDWKICTLFFLRDLSKKLQRIFRKPIHISNSTSGISTLSKYIPNFVLIQLASYLIDWIEYYWMSLVTQRTYYSMIMMSINGVFFHLCFELWFHPGFYDK